MLTYAAFYLILISSNGGIGVVPYKDINTCNKIVEQAKDMQRISWAYCIEGNK